MKLFLYGILFFVSNLFPDSLFPSFEQTKEALKKSESVLLDKKGEILVEIRTYPKERRLQWISLQEVSSYFLESLVLAEDKRFYEHKGVDWLALGAGTIQTLTSSTTRGASTITMQLAGILTEKFKPRKRNLFQKWNQIQLALELEKFWSKQQILEAYINLVGYRGELVGIDAASRGLFQKQAHGLNKLEGILLAAMIKNPSFSLKRLIQRACYLQKLQYEIEDCSSLEQFAYEKLTPKYEVQHPEKWAYHLANLILKRGEKEQEVYTTLDKQLQIQAINSCQERIRELQKQNVRDCAILVVENQTGEVLAYVGGSGSYSLSPEINSILAKRQAGSTLKPFIYALAFEKKILTPTSILEDKPFSVQVGTGIYNPGNYEGFHGDVTAKVALASSLNSPAVQVLDMVGINEVHEKLTELGFSNLKEGEFYGLSLALGSLDVNLWELVQAYTVFANRGLFQPIHYLRQENHSLKKRVYSPEVSFIISEILKDREARALTFGLDNPLATRVPASVKTGTSKDMRDNWCVGYTKDYTVGVWVGNHSGEPMWNVSGVSGAAPIWAELIHYLYKNKSYQEEPPPSNVVRAEVKNELTRTTNPEWFILGTETQRIQKSEPKLVNGIKRPLPNTIIAIDPDIPTLAQTLSIEAKIPDPNLIWYLNGKRIANAGSPFLWNLQVGNFSLELRNKNGSLVEKLNFQVK